MRHCEGYIGLDIGGTAAKAGVFDRSGAMVGFGRCSYAPAVNEEAPAEIPIEVIYEAARAAVNKALGRRVFHILAMAVSSQGQTFVSLDERDRPLHRAIIWYDTRAARQAERLQRSVSRTHGPKPLIQSISTAPKIMWLKERFPRLMERAKRHLLLPDYVAYRLTGDAATDPMTALTSGLYADGAGEYHAAALKVSGIAREQVSRILQPGSPVGTVLPAMAETWGLSPDTLLVTGTNDQCAGALGAGNCRPRILSETTGTCLALLTLTPRLPTPMPVGLLGGRFAIQPYRYVLAYCKTAGVVLDWFQRELCRGLSLEDLDRLAAEAPIGARGVSALPHFDGMFSPTPDPVMTGRFSGLRLQTTRADLYRAILESLAFSLRENIEFLRQNGLRIDVIRSIGGGAKSDVWLQMKADATGMSVEKPMVTEAAVMGAAMLAAVGHGEFGSLQQSSEALYRRVRVFRPNEKNRLAYNTAYRRYLELGAG